MAAPTPPKTPRYLLHKPSDRAYVRVEGRFIYLGRYGSQASHDTYAAVVATILAGGSPHAIPLPLRNAAADPGPTLTVRGLASRYLAHAEAYYVKNGKQTAEVGMIRLGLHQAVAAFGDLPACEFGPLCLETVRDSMVETSLARTTVNGRVQRVRRAYKWAASKELIPAAVHHALTMVEGLKSGRTEARETAPVMPIADNVVEATLPQLPEVVADMVQMQRLTGARPGEVCSLRPCDVDRSGDVWTYRPGSHKTEHHGRDRVVFVGPRAQAVLLRYLARDPLTHCFRPCDSEAKRRAQQHAARTTPMSCGNRPGTNVKAIPSRSAGERYTKDTYANAIRRACIRAGVEHWSPNRLRHTYATTVRRDHGLEAAQVTLGHSTAKTTEIYAEKNHEAGAAVAGLIG